MKELRTGETETITLEPIRTAGPAALDTHGEPGLQKVTARELRITWNDAQHETVIIRSDDLLKPVAQNAKPPVHIPQDGDIKSAALDFQFDDDTLPHRVEVSPPSTIHLQFPNDANRILAWISKSPLHAAASALAIILLALASATAPALDDDDGDQDDTDSDRLAFAT